MTEKKLAVVAVGGNSLIIDKNRKTIPDQFDAVRETASHLADMIEAGWDLVVTHGNGPQVGFILRRSELALHELHPVPLDYCGADTQGAIGYMIQKALRNEFYKRSLKKQAVTVVTQVEVDPEDSAFESPSKPIGSFLDKETAHERMKSGQTFVEDAGRGWRQVVPSPKPKRIVEVDAIKNLLGAGFVVVAVGGGGIPVVERPSGFIRGIEAVIDKDFASGLLANNIGAELLVISTAVEKVALNYNKPNQRWLDEISVADAEKFIQEGHFAPGSMLPKIQAVIAYLKSGGKKALITDPPNLKRALDGQTGTWIVP